MCSPEPENTQEPADIRRLAEAGVNNDDLLTQSAATRRAFRLSQKGMPLDETAIEILGLDKLPKDDD